MRNSHPQANPLQQCAPLTTVSSGALPNPLRARATSYHLNFLRLQQLSPGVKVAASSRRPRQPSSGRNQCNRQGTPQGSVPPTSQGEGLPRPFFHQREAHLRLPPPLCFFAPETSKPTPDHIATLVVTQSATAPHHCAAPLLPAPPCPTSSSPAAASTVQTC